MHEGMVAPVGVPTWILVADGLVEVTGASSWRQCVVHPESTTALSEDGAGDKLGATLEKNKVVEKQFLLELNN